MSATIEVAARHYAARDLAQAASVCLEIIRSQPAHFDALHLLGVICTNRGQFADGVSYLLRAEAERPHDAQLQVNLGAAYGSVQRFDKAAEAYRRALAMNHRTPGILNNLGLALQGLNKPDEALQTLQTAIDIDPGNDPVLYNLARSKIAAGRLADAEADLKRLIARLPPETSAERVREATKDLARVLADQGRAEDGWQVLRAAAAKHHDPVSFRWHEALLLLLLGRFDEGWPAYESRWTGPGTPPPGHCVLDLNEVAGRRVLVKEEQGRGDVIQFLRYVPLLAAWGARIRLSVYADLIPLAQEMPEVEVVLGPDDDETEYDVLTCIMSLPLSFLTETGTIPDNVPYLRVPGGRVGRMRHHLGRPTGARIGLAWSGSIVSQPRSAVPVATLQPLLQRPGIEFHCLQKDIRPADRNWLANAGVITTHEAALRDFGDTAALIDAMDLVISIDTAVAHLAGALARPVWIMLPFNPDWRWMLGRDDSPWYPTARLFRQPKPGDWDSVVASVVDALRF